MIDLDIFVGLFVRHGNNLGMIDAVHGERLGFVWSDKASWTAELVDVEDVTICESDEDCSAALNSARLYFSREVDSLRNRISLGLKQDSQKVLTEMLHNCEAWLTKLS